jgi:Tol biopolymer transport system component
LPHWSPQDNRIVFEFDPANPVNDDFCNIATMNRNGGAMKILPLANGDACEAAPTFSADGHRIYYEGFDGVSRDAVFSMDVNGNDRRFVSDCQGTGLTDPEVSPDGTMISFTCYSPDGDGALFDANIDGSGLRQLTPFSAEDHVHLDGR